jgi:hypothetical protein
MILALNKLVVMEGNENLGCDIRKNGVTDHVMKAFLDHIESEDLIRKDGLVADLQKYYSLKFATPLHMSKVPTWHLQYKGTNCSDSVLVMWSIGKQTTLQLKTVKDCQCTSIFS